MTTETKTVRSRMSDPSELVPEVRAVAEALVKAVNNGSVPQSTMTLMGLRAGQLVGSTYITMRQAGMLRAMGEPEERITAVATWRDAPYFTGAERAALALVEAVLQPNEHGERVSDELYAEVSEHYDAKALATLVLAIGQVGFFIPIGLVGKPVPGVPASEQWT